MNIPFSPPYLDEDIKNEVLNALDSGWITTGPRVKLLEEEMASYCGVEAALGVNSATSALMLALHWWGVQPGDEIIVPAYTYCATALAALHLGARVVMVDIREDFNMDPDRVREAITHRTKAILPVDFAGWPCDYDRLSNLLQEESLKQQFQPSNERQAMLGRVLILADAAHSLGAVYQGKPSGSLADMSVFSFHAVKNVTTAEGGMLCLNLPAPFSNPEIYQLLRIWSLNGQTRDAFAKTVSGGWKYDIIYPGFKINLPDVLAAIGLGQLRKYRTSLLGERIRIFEKYDALFAQESWAIRPPFHADSARCSCHLYPLRIQHIAESQRDAIIERIALEQVAVNVHFIPLPLLTVFRERGYRITDFPVSYRQYCGEISLPIYPQLSDENCDRVARVVIRAVQEELGTT